MKKYLKYLPPAVLILFGSTLEIYYYWYRFTGDGIHSVFALISGFVLTVFLIVVAQYKQTGARFLAGILIAYSIFCTSAGQAYSLEQVRMSQAVARAQDANAARERESIEKTVESLRDQWDQIESQKRGSVETLEDRFEWKNTLAIAEAEQKNIMDDIAGYNQQLAGLYARENILPPDIYEYYEGVFEIPAWLLQVILQMLLSGFIALMAPIGVAIWPKIIQAEKKRIRKRPAAKLAAELEINELAPEITEPAPQPEPEPEIAPAISAEKVRRWVQINYMSISTGRSNKIIAPETFKTYTQQQGENEIVEIHERLRSLAVKNGIIDHDGTVIESRASRAADKLIAALKEDV
jgi:uncharacterized protein YhaN